MWEITTTGYIGLEISGMPEHPRKDPQEDKQEEEAA